MFPNKKLKAYTLSEIIVVLILTSIVVGLALSALQLIQKQMTALRQNNENKLRIKSLETKLSILFNQSENVEVIDQAVYFYEKKDTLETRITPEAFTIENDTIELKAVNINTYFRGKEIENGCIDALSLSIKLNERISKSLFVSRTNDARTKLEQWE